MAVRTGRQGLFDAEHVARAAYPEQAAHGAHAAHAAHRAGVRLAMLALFLGVLTTGTLALSPASASATATAGKSLTITTQRVEDVGTVLATKSGLTLYRFSMDPAGRATCTGVCAQEWPPLLLPKGITRIKAPHGVKGLSVAHVSGGQLQVFFHHQALYTFVSDKKKGQDGGQGVQNDWFAVLSNGKSSALATTTTPTSTTKSTRATPPTPTPTPTATPTSTPSATTPKAPPTTPTTPTTPTSSVAHPASPTPPPVTTTTQAPATTTTVPSGGGVAY